MPSLLDECVEASAGADVGPRCELGMWLAEQPDDTVEDVNAAMGVPWEGPGKIRHTVLRVKLNAKYGTDFSIHQVRHHRRRQCRCEW